MVTPSENPFMGNAASIYQSKAALKWIALAFSLIIGIASVLYTNSIVEELKEREERYIELFAKTQEYTSDPDNSENLIFIFQEIVTPNNSIPVIVVDADGNPSIYRNIDIDSSKHDEEERKKILKKELKIMEQEYEPITISWTGSNDPSDYQYIYYRNSDLIYRLRYYPYIQLSVIAAFVFFGYVSFSYSRKAEQNQVWVGLAKETAHQLGTPLSSLMAWLEIMKIDDDIKDKEVVTELEKDISKLELITSRFSSIGSVPVLKEENISKIIEQTVNYLKKRTSKKVNLYFECKDDLITADINKPLFDWVIENLCKNAIDAMSGEGEITITLKEGKYGDALIDVKDTGKGIPSSKIKEIFQPGFSTKKRGWGLGLTLAKRIIENYHNGKISVKESILNKGTTFRIILRK
ncbi:two-component sensor histidine kinase [Marivirga tractuosa]|uniref:histidine kinase n=1 Tax=Marivirga tractuosa (strain ATCC 23168 / DSM 4126 / NBRC 15989 / NCIMB 1408 / VKM B-1430 / H-43) TaxID=643867 RepID=E4TQA6_MARTH|nr:HAMP domain-containing sensor histidine kinase [Marivirga tractuosa]ADR22629.1 integral membrane sensor signal transduction histidine kinase [Marivirga tractuosa DSM 4126]BDD16700.1 two-component sensor histidine kinase [Marivirga tractuosa]